MTRRIDEHDLLAFIEGELDGAAADDVRAALERDDDLRDWVEAATRDRNALRTWGRATEARAPEGLIEQAMRLGERDALIGEPPSRRDARVVLLRRYAIAAAIMLSVGVGFFLAMPLWDDALRPDAYGPVAMAPQLEAPADDMMLDRDMGALAFRSREGGRAEASPEALEGLTDDRSGARSARSAAPVPSAAAVEEPVATDAALARLAEDAAPVRAIGRDEAEAAQKQSEPEAVITLADAARLAGQRRLGVRALAAEPENAAGALAAAIAQWDTPARTWSGAQATEGGASVVVALPADQNAIQRVLDALSRSGVASLRMVALQREIGPSQARRAQDIFWWTLPPDRWAGHAQGAMRIDIDPEPQPAETPDQE